MTHSPETCLHCLIIDHIIRSCSDPDDPDRIDGGRLLDKVHQLGQVWAAIIGLVVHSGGERMAQEVVRAFFGGVEKKLAAKGITATFTDGSTAAENTH